MTCVTLNKRHIKNIIYKKLKIKKLKIIFSKKKKVKKTKVAAGGRELRLALAAP
jgi:hypothetical protein